MVFTWKWVYCPRTNSRDLLGLNTRPKGKKLEPTNRKHEIRTSHEPSVFACTALSTEVGAVRRPFWVSKSKWRSDTQSISHTNTRAFVSQSGPLIGSRHSQHIRTELQCRHHGVCCVSVAPSAGQHGKP